MARRTLAEWLSWQESLHPRWMDLGLERVAGVAARLELRPPAGAVFTVAGTNGKGSTVALLEASLERTGRRVGTYTSPHLVRYNERVRVAGDCAQDAELVAAFEVVEAARGDTPLTFFEYGTLAAFCHFTTARCDAWVLEVGLGGRLDAVNVLAPDYALITTIDLDHREYLGDTIEQIAAEKAGIMRGGRPAFFGDWPVPAAIRRAADASGARLHALGHHYDFTPSRPLWAWRGQSQSCAGLPWPPGGTLAQLRNASLVLAVLEQHAPTLFADPAILAGIVAGARQPGRFQVAQREQEWVLDVAHNAQAAATLREQLGTLPEPAATTVVIGMLGDKPLEAFAAALGPLADRWLACSVRDPRARSAASIAAQLRELGCRSVTDYEDAEAALVAAAHLTPPGGRIVVTGSFRVVGPALVWLGLY